jgi:arylsulfatase A-like enzyme
MGLYDSSFIIVFGDHGEAFYEHELWQHAVTVYEEMIAIPLIVKWPGKSPTGRSSVPAHQVDILPTILETVGVPAPFHQGTSLRRLVTNPTDVSRILVSEAGWMSSSRAFMKVAFRDGALKYVAHYEDDASRSWPPQPRVEEELFDLAKDASERRNIVRKSEEQRTAFLHHLQSFLDEAARRRPQHAGEPVILDDATRKRLEALGYLQRQ